MIQFWYKAVCKYISIIFYRYILYIFAVNKYWDISTNCDELNISVFIALNDKFFSFIESA